MLDLSWNSLGHYLKNHTGVNQLCEMLKQNKDIVHLDLSNNNFNLKECIEISIALENNKTIYGFHFQGNFGYVD